MIWRSLALLAAVVLLERRRPLRRSEARSGARKRQGAGTPLQPADTRHGLGEGRLVTNLAIAGITTAVAQATMAPLVGPLARRVERDGLGLAQRLPLPAWARDALAVLLLDYTLYWWHVLEHRLTWLYRFHQVHHADLELDASTAARFHFGEFLLSVPWRAAQILVLGASPRALGVWQRLTMASVLFHHSNLRLPLVVERALARVLMTPRLHGIHHSIVRDEQDSNWSSGLTVWDRLHGTFRDDVVQQEIELGVPSRRTPAEVALRPSLTMPFEPLPEWRLPDGTVPQRRPRVRTSLPA